MLKRLGIKHAVTHFADKTASRFNHVARDTTSIFNHINRDTKSFADQLKHGKIGGVHLFGKDSLGSHALHNVSVGAQAVGQALGSAGSHLNKFADSGVVEAALGSEPVGRAILGATRFVGGGLKAGSSLSKSIGAIAKQKNYSGSAKQVAGQIRGRVTNL